MRAMAGSASRTPAGSRRSAAVRAANSVRAAASGSVPSDIRYQTSSKLRVRASSIAEYCR